ncbi:cytochrome b561 and DOMON domain-containing protein At5g47530-like [Macadamia integrifolia]|uniref:cytochrome b561 and DOMON domain-containing protein At5g47530-like n=1 Tax=Macadamia integrifolia TaxID=60698 RepID=UPI001C532746|nr:cytochrome b561 and DOMON domain-containing protein At5g47530-like [Macadamia integrifolia]
MATTFRPVLLFCVLISLFFSSSAQSCSSYTFNSNRIFSKCSDLPVLNSFLHWTYNSSSGTIDIAYRQTGVSSSRWVAWAINLKSATAMAGAQALVAYQLSNGTMTAYTSSIDNDSPTLQQSSLSFNVYNLSAEFLNSEMIIYATVELPNNSTTVNQLWQDGPLSGTTPMGHQTSGDNIKSLGSISFLSGQSTAASGGNSRARRKNVHGVLSAVSWGILMPIGVIIARYLKVFKSADPAWFYLHIACQSSAYIVGVAGWGLGLKLGSESSGIQYDSHRNIGITLFVFATLQVFALLLRPSKDHKYRLYWNIYHWSIGYSVIILSIINIFKGFDILDPEKKWKKAYIGIIICLGIIALMLEAITWFIVLKRRRSISTEKSHSGVNGVHGNGDGARPGV